MSRNTPVASNSLTVRVRLANKPGMLGRITSAIGEAGGDIGAVDVVEASQKEMTRDITFKASDEAHGQAIVERLRGPDVGGQRRPVLYLRQDRIQNGCR
jgi:malate dehydrogenase (oxaloacetate-decarboxylating)